MMFRLAQGRDKPVIRYPGLRTVASVSLELGEGTEPEFLPKRQAANPYQQRGR